MSVSVYDIDDVHTKVSFTMSCFSGIIPEIPGISIDNFADENLKSTVYFLSHCHSDHMVGLSSPLLSERFQSNPWIKLYCHPVTKALLAGMNRFKDLLGSIEVLELGKEELLHTYNCDGKETNCFTVSIIPAGHCPGSVMFLIRTKEGNTTLYTGDFRYAIGHIPKIRELFDENRQLLHPIQRVYIDTTFCIPEANFIPTRESCCDLIISTIKDWLHQDPERIVHILSKSNYGYEFLMARLSFEFGCRVHVTPAQYHRYRFVKDIVKNISTDVRESGRIHFCQNEMKLNAFEVQPRCVSAASSNVLTLIPSAMYFTKSSVKPSEMVRCVNERRIRVCYATHSSFSEVVDFLKSLKPSEIYPCVRPNESMSLADVRKSLAHLEHNPTEQPNNTIRNSGPHGGTLGISLKRKRPLVI